MTEPLRYATGRDLFAAVKAKSVAKARQHSQQTQQVLRQFVFDRLLARLFLESNAPWVLKGGNALMSREPVAARASLDLDLAARHEYEHLDDLARRFEAAAALDLGDHFRFVVTSRREHQGESQPRVTGLQITLSAYCGTKNVETVKIDLVTGTLITGTPEPVARTSLAIDGLNPVVVTAYPIADHIADKICATAETHGNTARPSSRVRDLVDLVVIATTQTVDAGDLIHAVRSEWSYRGLAGEPAFDPPVSWATGYGRLAPGTPGCAAHPTFMAAVHLVRNEFLEPVLTGHTAGGHWSPTQGQWQGAPTEATRTD